MTRRPAFRLCKWCGRPFAPRPRQKTCDPCRESNPEVPVAWRGAAMQLPPGHEERLALYAARAAARRPLFAP
jgi:hypothetical protein